MHTVVDGTTCLVSFFKKKKKKKKKNVYLVTNCTCSKCNYAYRGIYIYMIQYNTIQNNTLNIVTYM